MFSRSLGHCQRSVGSQNPIHAAPAELGRASGEVVTINMTLLTELEELDPSPAPETRARNSEDERTPPRRSPAGITCRDNERLSGFMELAILGRWKAILHDSTARH